MIKSISSCLILALLLVSTGMAEQRGRPDSLTLGSFQFGPDDRWAFSHLREVLHTAHPFEGHSKKASLIVNASLRLVCVQRVIQQRILTGHGNRDLE